MHLIDDQNDIALLADLLDESLHAAFKLASELRSGNKSRKVKQVDLLVAQLIRHLVHCYALCKALGHGGLADAGLADEAGIVLLAAVEYLNYPLKLLLTADHIIELARPCTVGEVDAVVIQKLFLRRSAALGLILGWFRTALGCIVGVLTVLTAEKAV